ncbi:protein of unknown function [Chryseobacterium oranimense]|uniref:DUF3127 domain-containing protein n=1 Tax=Chryseobacterium oranimense TaxID=421058 RepID=A0A1M5X997_9FLAO|nr:DUF3127 domain-containing protein [Chryseobacterium oranimense]SHH95783.1 protein of unknown function [Chryseobacterium oranimense]
MELIAVIKRIYPIQYFKNNFQKREFIVLTEERFPQKLIIEVHNLRTDIVDPFKVGDRVRIGINIIGCEYIDRNNTVKYFNNIVAWKIVHMT